MPRGPFWFNLVKPLRVLALGPGFVGQLGVSGKYSSGMTNFPSDFHALMCPARIICKMRFWLRPYFLATCAVVRSFESVIISLQWIIIFSKVI